MKNRMNWLRFESLITLTYVTTSLVGMAAAFGALRLIVQVRLDEYQMLPPILIPVLLAVAIAQSLINRRWLRRTRRWLEGGDARPEDPVRVYRELLAFPWRASAFSFLLWCISLGSLMLARVLILEAVPGFRDAAISLAIVATGLVAWTLQYFLFRRLVLGALEAFAADREDMQRAPRIPIVTKYAVLFGFLFLGAVIYGSTLVYGLSRRTLLESFHAEVRDLFLTSETLIYEFEFGDGFDIQTKLAALNAVVPGTFRIVPERTSGATDLYDLFVETQWLHGILPYSEVELQRIPERWILTRPLAGMTRGLSTQLEYEVETSGLRRQINRVLMHTLGAGLLIGLLVIAITVLFLFDLTRPIRRVRLGLHPRGERLLAPPLVVSDDELMGFAFGVRAMFHRLRGLFQDMLAAYWEVKDRRTQLQELALRFQQRTERDSQQIQLIAKRLRGLAEQVQSVGQELGVMSNLSETVTATVRMMNDAVHNTQAEAGAIRARVRDGREWLQVTRDQGAQIGKASAALQRWAQETGGDFESIRRRFRDMAQAASTAGAGLAELESATTEAGENARTHHLLLAGEGERYGDGILLIQDAQSRLDVVMRQFGKVESIREQVDMLSFQAAVVAAQSLSYERDFRVVADEIRDLSGRAAAGIHQIFSRVWMLNHQGRLAMERILASRARVAEAIEFGRRAEAEAAKAQQSSEAFVTAVEALSRVTREESDRVARLGDGLDEAFPHGQSIHAGLAEAQDTLLGLDVHLQRLEEISRRVDLLLHDQVEGLRTAGGAADRIFLSLRELLSTGDGMLMQSRTMRSLLERLVDESVRTGERIGRTLEDLGRIEEEILRNEVEVKRVSAELQSR